MKKMNRTRKWTLVKESYDDASKALAKGLGVKGRDIHDMDGEYEYYEPDYVFGVDFKDGEQAIYLVYADEESARTAAADDLGEKFRDEPPILGAAIDYFGFPSLCEYISDLDEDELEELGELEEELNKEEFAEYVHHNINVDYRGFAEFNIDEFGPAWHLANYDGKEIELPNGMYAYRVD